MTSWQSAITRLSRQIESEHGFLVKLCGEIECMVAGAPDDAFWLSVKEALEAAGVELESIAREEAAHQFEFRLKPTEPLAAATQLDTLRQIVQSKAQENDFECSFAPMIENPDIINGLHLHLHLTNHQNGYLFIKQEEQMSTPLAASLGGLLFTMRALMPCFALDDAAYARLSSGRDHVPQTVSWGNNNRSVALRMPETVVPVRHIEHRVCGADAHPFAATWAILVGLHYGLTHHPEIGAQMFGNASDAQYDLPRLPMSLADAQAAMDKAEWLDDYMRRDELKRLLANRTA